MGRLKPGMWAGMAPSSGFSRTYLFGELLCEALDELAGGSSSRVRVAALCVPADVLHVIELKTLLVLGPQLQVRDHNVLAHLNRQRAAVKGTPTRSKLQVNKAWLVLAKNERRIVATHNDCRGRMLIHMYGPTGECPSPATPARSIPGKFDLNKSITPSVIHLFIHTSINQSAPPFTQSKDCIA
eukprot:scaffold104542_cov28-Prasinocladus_malaysianus.AAC.1